VAPIGADGRPFTPEPDELTLWAQADSEAQQLQKKSRLYEDRLLDEYLARIADRLVPDGARGAGGPAFRLAVLRDPTLNAFALPNGRIYIHTGLLASLANEAQLATIVAHEMTHVINRHALSVTREASGPPFAADVPARAASIGRAAATGSGSGSGDHLGAAALSQTANVLLGPGLQLAAGAAIDGYGRDRELEADAGAMASLVRAGYDPKEAPRAFARLGKASAARGTLEIFFFGNRTGLTERVESMTGLLTGLYAAAAAAPEVTRITDEFQLRMRTIVRENARLEIETGRFTPAREQLDRVLAITPDDAVAELYYGDLYRLQSQRSRDVADRADKARLAIERYERAARLDPTFADPFRELGFVHYQQQETARARTAFQSYLALKPDAPDASRIKDYLRQLDD
jgi:beta-barrel assembly-enhancing protease